MQKLADSNSDVQVDIENYMFDRIKDQLKDTTLESGIHLPIEEGSNDYICPDFYSKETERIGEIHAHLGRLKGSQPDKVASDVLKMLFYDKVSGITHKKYIAVCCPEECKQLNGKSFLAKAIREFEVEVLYIELPEEMKQQLAETMKKQNLRFEKK